jgi:hypothetical protein
MRIATRERAKTRTFARTARVPHPQQWQADLVWMDVKFLKPLQKTNKVSKLL